jgi:Tol biopolymer transport system component
MSPDGSNFSAILIDQQPSYLTSPRWSPDGEWIAFIGGRSFADGSIFRVRPDGRGLLRLAEGLRNIRDLQWSPDGQWLLFQANHEGPEDIYRIRPDGSQLENLTPGPEWGFAPQYAPVAGREWHPIWLTLVAVSLMILSMIGRLKP